MLSEVGEAYQGLSWLGKSNRLRLKFVTKVNGKDVLWSTYTLRFINSENFQDCQAAQEGNDEN